MLPLFGILQPRTGPETSSAEAPRKKSFFGGAYARVATPPAEQDALYLAGKQPEPPDRDAPMPIPRGLV